MKTVLFTFVPFPDWLCDTQIGHTTEPGHAVENVEVNPGFGCLGLHFVAARVGPDDLSVAPDLSLAA